MLSQRTARLLTGLSPAVAHVTGDCQADVTHLYSQGRVAGWSRAKSNGHAALRHRCSASSSATQPSSEIRHFSYAAAWAHFTSLRCVRLSHAPAHAPQDLSTHLYSTTGGRLGRGVGGVHRQEFDGSGA